MKTHKKRSLRSTYPFSITQCAHYCGRYPQAICPTIVSKSGYLSNKKDLLSIGNGPNNILSKKYKGNPLMLIVQKLEKSQLHRH